MTKVKEEMLYIEERIALNNIINELQVAVDFLKRVNNGFSYRVFNIARLDSEAKSGMTIDSVSLSEAESLKVYLDSVYRLSTESLDDFQQGINGLSDLITAIKDNRKSGGGA
jgi:hypothetical protein